MPSDGETASEVHHAGQLWCLSADRAVAAHLGGLGQLTIGRVPPVFVELMFLEAHEK
jgi:hypothetical protein